MSEWVMVRREMLYTTFDGAKCCIFCGPDQDWHSPGCPLSGVSAYEITEEDIATAAEEIARASGYSGYKYPDAFFDPQARAALTAFARRLGGAPVTDETKGD